MRLSCIAAVVSTVLAASLSWAPPALAAQPKQGEGRSVAVRKNARRAVDSPAPAAASGQARADKVTETRTDDAPATRGPARIDFDDRLIQGQTNKSGAVYLFDRKELVIRSMVQQRTSYRQQIVQDVLAE